MAYFPAFIQIEKYHILLVGGGDIAYEKLLRLLDFEAKVTLIAEHIRPKVKRLLQEQNITYKQRAYKDGDIKDYDMVIVAVDDLKLQKSIYEESRKQNCLCNAVDAIEYCDFIFPAYIKKEELIIAISSSGTAPALSKHLKHYLLKKLPSTLLELLKRLKYIREQEPKGVARMKRLKEETQNYFKELQA